MNSLYKNTDKFWKKKYNSPNVESIVFRLQAKILKHEYNLPKKKSKLIDFGCGEGASSNFFASQGYKTFGLDISNSSIQTAKKRFEKNKNLKFEVCKFIPNEQKIYGFKNNVDVIFALQSLYYLGKNDFYELLEIFNNSLNILSIFFFSLSLISILNSLYLESISLIIFSTRIILSLRNLVLTSVFEFFCIALAILFFSSMIFCNELWFAPNS